MEDILEDNNENIIENVTKAFKLYHYIVPFNLNAIYSIDKQKKIDSIESICNVLCINKTLKNNNEKYLVLDYPLSNLEMNFSIRTNEYQVKNSKYVIDTNCLFSFNNDEYVIINNKKYLVQIDLVNRIINFISDNLKNRYEYFGNSYDYKISIPSTFSLLDILFELNIFSEEENEKIDSLISNKFSRTIILSKLKKMFNISYDDKIFYDLNYNDVYDENNLSFITMNKENVIMFLLFPVSLKPEEYPDDSFKNEFVESIIARISSLLDNL